MGLGKLKRNSWCKLCFILHRVLGTWSTLPWGMVEVGKTAMIKRHMNRLGWGYILTGCILAWYSNFNVQKSKRLQRVVAQSSTSRAQLSLSFIWGTVPRMQHLSLMIRTNLAISRTSCSCHQARGTGACSRTLPCSGRATFLQPSGCTTLILPQQPNTMDHL